MSRENVEVIRAVYAASPPFRVETLEELFSPEVEWLPAQDSLLAGSSYRGYEGIRRFWDDLFSAWDEYIVEPEEFRAEGDQVVVINRVRARTRGIEVDELWSSLFTLRDGRIVHFQGFRSRDGALEAVGLAE